MAEPFKQHRSRLSLRANKFRTSKVSTSSKCDSLMGTSSSDVSVATENKRTSGDKLQNKNIVKLYGRQIPRHLTSIDSCSIISSELKCISLLYSSASTVFEKESERRNIFYWDRQSKKSLKALRNSPLQMVELISLCRADWSDDHNHISDISVNKTESEFRHAYFELRETIMTKFSKPDSKNNSIYSSKDAADVLLKKESDRYFKLSVSAIIKSEPVLFDESSYLKICKNSDLSGIYDDDETSHIFTQSNKRKRSE